MSPRRWKWTLAIAAGTLAYGIVGTESARADHRRGRRSFSRSYSYQSYGRSCYTPRRQYRPTRSYGHRSYQSRRSYRSGFGRGGSGFSFSIRIDRPRSRRYGYRGSRGHRSHHRSSGFFRRF